jgi:hypothetical protein
LPTKDPTVAEGRNKNSPDMSMQFKNALACMMGSEEYDDVHDKLTATLSVSRQHTLRACYAWVFGSLFILF